MNEKPCPCCGRKIQTELLEMFPPLPMDWLVFTSYPKWREYHYWGGLSSSENCLINWNGVSSSTTKDPVNG